MTLISARDLTVGFDRVDGTFSEVVKSVDLSLEQGEFVGLVGESGSGKSTLGYALTRLLKAPGRIAGGSIEFAGSDIATLSQEQVRAQRAGGFAMVLQAGMNALSPVKTIRSHFADVMGAHASRQGSSLRPEELVEKVELSTTVLDKFPGELSGGMRQRASIAIALALKPKFMVFDEPTTALDVLVQASVMETINDLQLTEGFTALLISHDLGLVLGSARRVLVMQDGVIVEDSPSKQILADPQHPYTKELLSHFADPRAEHVSLPGIESREAPTAGSRRAPSSTTAIEISGVSKQYQKPKRGESPVLALEDVSFSVAPGQSLALVGQSGSGKSTLAKILTGVETASAGSVTVGSLDLKKLSRRGRRALHRDVQLVFQDPFSALNPLHPVSYTLGRPLENYHRLRGPAKRKKTIELLEQVGLTPGDTFIDRRPHELSGGQRQRVVIARALASEPKILIADEPVSMLDVTLRAGVLALLDDLRRERGMSLVYITHDLLSARVLTDRIVVLRDGRIVESGATPEVMRNPSHPYTQALLGAAPNPWSQEKN